MEKLILIYDVVNDKILKKRGTYEEINKFHNEHFRHSLYMVVTDLEDGLEEMYLEEFKKKIEYARNTKKW